MYHSVQATFGYGRNDTMRTMDIQNIVTMLILNLQMHLILWTTMWCWLPQKVGVVQAALGWFKSYLNLSDWFQYVHINGSTSSACIKFRTRSADIPTFMQPHFFKSYRMSHVYADDTPIDITVKLRQEDIDADVQCSEQSVT